MENPYVNAPQYTYAGPVSAAVSGWVVTLVRTWGGGEHTNLLYRSWDVVAYFGEGVVLFVFRRTAHASGGRVWVL